MRPNSARPGSARVPRPSSARNPGRQTQGGIQGGSDEAAAATAVKVAVRIRPFTSSDGPDPVTVVERSTADPRSVEVNDSINLSKGARQFNFDHVFTDTQSEVFEKIGLPMVEEAYKGFNVCLFAYGQTGSGKTYSVQGDDDTVSLSTSTSVTGSDSSNGLAEGVGIVPRFVKELFSQAQSKVDEDKELTVKITMAYLEVYNEKVRDLLAPLPRGAQERESLDIHEDSTRRVFVKGLGIHPVLGTARVAQLLKMGNDNRQRAETKMNEFSSRSHSIIQFTLSQIYDVPEKKDVESVIWLVDLAGSERQTKAEATGQQLEEAKKINHSLLMLGRALNSFSEGRNEFLSLRESKLTRLLSECFGGNTKTWMLATVSPAQYNLSESISTLEYAVNAKKITNRAVVNKKAKQLEMKELREASTKLQAALEQEREQAKELERRKQLLTAEVSDLQALDEEASFQQGGRVSDGRPSGQLRKMLEGQLNENDEIRKKIAELKKEYQLQVEAENAAAQRREKEEQQKALTEVSRAKLNRKPNAFVGRCGLSLSTISQIREKKVFRLTVDVSVGRHEDAKGHQEPTTLLVESYQIDSAESPNEISSTTAVKTLDDLLGKQVFVYLNVLGAENLPRDYAATSFVNISACHERVVAPQQSKVVKESTDPVFHSRAVYALGKFDEAMLERYSNFNLFSFELFGMPK